MLNIIYSGIKLLRTGNEEQLQDLLLRFMRVGGCLQDEATTEEGFEAACEEYIVLPPMKKNIAMPNKDEEVNHHLTRGIMILKHFLESPLFTANVTDAEEMQQEYAELEAKARYWDHFKYATSQWEQARRDDRMNETLEEVAKAWLEKWGY